MSRQATAGCSRFHQSRDTTPYLMSHCRARASASSRSPAATPSVPGKCTNDHRPPHVLAELSASSGRRDRGPPRRDGRPLRPQREAPASGILGECPLIRGSAGPLTAPPALEESNSPNLWRPRRARIAPGLRGPYQRAARREARENRWIISLDTRRQILALPSLRRPRDTI